MIAAMQCDKPRPRLRWPWTSRSWLAVTGQSLLDTWYNNFLTLFQSFQNLEVYSRHLSWDLILEQNHLFDSQFGDLKKHMRTEDSFTFWRETIYTVGTAESYSNVTQISVRAIFTFRFFYQNSGKRWNFKLLLFISWLPYCTQISTTFEEYNIFQENMPKIHEKWSIKK